MFWINIGKKGATNSLISRIALTIVLGKKVNIKENKKSQTREVIHLLSYDLGCAIFAAWLVALEQYRD